MTNQIIINVIAIPFTVLICIIVALYLLEMTKEFIPLQFLGVLVLIGILMYLFSKIISIIKEKELEK